MDWQTRAGLIGVATRKNDDRRLVISIDEDKQKDWWQTVALELPKSVESTEEVLENHAHVMLGRFPTMKTAMEAGEKYVAAWRKSSTMPDRRVCTRRSRTKPVKKLPPTYREATNRPTPS